MITYGLISFQIEIAKPKSSAAVLRYSIDNPFESRLWASHVEHFSTSARQSMTSKLKYWLWMPFFCGGLGLDPIELVCKMSRITELLRARTCALGWERHLIVAGRRHCMCICTRILVNNSILTTEHTRVTLVSKLEFLFSNRADYSTKTVFMARKHIDTTWDMDTIWYGHGNMRNFKIFRTRHDCTIRYKINLKLT